MLRWKPKLKHVLITLIIAELVALSYPAWSWIFPSSTTITILANTHYNPTQALATDSNNTYTIKNTMTANNISFPNRSLRIDKGGKQLWINITSGTNQRVNIWQWYTSNTFTLEYTITGTYNTTLYTQDYGEPTDVQGADSYGYHAASHKLWFITTPSSSQYVYILFNSYSFTFLGPYNETTGLRINPATGTAVTAHFMDGNTTETFTVNGTYNYVTTKQIQYFSYATSSPRQYWRGLNENASNLYIFDDDLTTYTVSFLDLAGALDEYPFVTAQRYINGSLMTVEKRMVDEDKKLQMNLKQTAKYDIIISDGATYQFGDLLMTGTTSFQLTLKGIEFPQNIILAYKYVRMYADRHDNLTSISMVYQDTLAKTTQVVNTVYYQNNTVAYTNTQIGVNTYNVTWTNAWYNTSYYAVMVSTHTQFGQLTYRTVLPRGYSTSPWSLDWLGSLPYGLTTSALIPLFIILCAMGVFSQRNAYVGMFIGVAITGLLVWIGWLPLASFPWAMIFAALLFTMLYALGRKRRPYLAE